MKKNLILFIFSIFIMFPACSMYWPGHIEPGYGLHKVIFQIQPDDAHILLNGRFIGEAYEFSSRQSALKLASKNHQIVIKKKGFIEEAVDLNNYLSHDIVVQLEMKKDPAHSTDIPEIKPEVQSKKPEYIPKTEPLKEPAKEYPPEEKQVLTASPITLEIQPADAAIYLNGKFWGITPEKGKIENLKLKPGSYTLDVIKPGFKSSRKTIEVKGQKQIRITIQLEKNEENETIVL